MTQVAGERGVRRVLLAGAWDEGPGYPRTEALVQGLQALGIEVSRCRVDAPWLGAGKRALLRQPWRWPGLLWASRSVRRKLQRRLVRDQAELGPDVILVPYPGQLVARAVAAVATVPVVLDLFLSAADTAAGDRKMFGARSWRARLLARAEARACGAVDRVLLDTPEHAAFVANGHPSLDANRFGAVPVGAPDATGAYPFTAPAPGEPLRLLFFGTGVPLHGLEHLLDGLEEARGRAGVSVALTLIGGDPVSRRRAREAGCRVLGEFEPSGTIEEELRRCHVVSGVFGRGEKTRRVIPFKVVQGLAAGRPVLTLATPAVLRVLEHGRSVWTCAAGDRRDIGNALCHLAQNPAVLVTLASGARSAFDTFFGAPALGAAAVAELRRAAGYVAVPSQSVLSPAPAAGRTPVHNNVVTRC